MFYEMKQGQVSDFASYTGFELVSVDDYFTFSQLEDAPEYSLKGKEFLGFEAIKTFEGEKWQVFKENSVVFDFVDGLVKPISEISKITTIKNAGNRYISNGMIQPGSIAANKVITGFDAFYSRDRQNWRYTEVSYV
jgi:hypothetical protein